MKPIQAIPFVEGYDDLDDDEIAIACASHHAEPAQLAAVRKVLARAGADGRRSRERRCRRAGPTGSSATTARASTPACSPPAARTAGRCIRTAIPRIRCSSGSPSSSAAATIGDRRLRRADVRDAALADGGAVHARRRRGSARRCARGPSSSAAAGADDTELMRALPGWIAKGGAEGLFCALSPDGVGWAFKVEDGATRALRPALGQVLGIDAFRTVPTCATASARS